MLLFLTACALGVGVVPRLARSQMHDGQTTIAVLNEILDAGPRFIGLPGHDRTARIIEGRLRELESLGHGQLIVHEIDQVVPTVTSAELTLGSAASQPVYPCWPNGAQLSTTSGDGIRGPLVYLGDGHESRLPARSVRGAVVAMEYNSHDRWKTVFGQGASAVIFLPPQDTTWVQSHAKFADIAFDAPRFYIDDPDLATVLRRGDGSQSVTLVCRMQWARRPVRSLIWVVAGTDSEIGREIVVFNARYDAGCVVPQLAYGAEQAVSPAVQWALAASFARKRPRRTVVLVWTGADTMNFASLRAILGTAHGRDSVALAAPIVAKQTVATLTDQRRLLGGDLRGALGASASIRDRYSMRIKRLRVALRRKLAELRRSVDRIDAEDARLGSLEQEEMRFSALQNDVQRNRIIAGHLPQLERITPAVRDRLEAELAEAVSRHARLRHDVDQVRPLFSRQRVVALIGLDLTSQGPAFGLYWQTGWQLTDHFDVLSRLGQTLVSRGKGGFDTGLPLAVIEDTFTGRRDWRSDVTCPLATMADVAQHFGYLSLAMVTAYDGRWRVDSPLDRREHLNLQRVRDQVPAFMAIARRSVDDPRFGITNRLKTEVGAIDGQAVMTGPGDARLNLGLAGRLVTVNTVRPVPRVVGTRWISVQHTTATGHYAFNHQSHYEVVGGAYIVDVVGLDGDGRIIESANHHQGVRKYPLSAPLRLGKAEVITSGIKSIMFQCTSQGVTGLRDPRYLQELTEIHPLLDRTGDDLRYRAVRAGDGLASLFMRPQDRWLLTASRGTRGVRMVMTAAGAEVPRGNGFGYDVPVRSILASTARDFYFLNRSRLQRLTRYGITGAVTDMLQEQTKRQLADADDSEQADSGGGALHHRRSALALQQIVYRHVMNTGNDVLLGLVFILLVLLPFSFYAERLVINAATIYGRILGFTVIFVFMMGLLYSFHPAFSISVTPLVVLLAFTLLLLSTIVIVILYGHFAEQFRTGVSEEHSASLSRLNVVGRAMIVGVANMRRRKIRTCFTLTTLIVMTFALLSLSGTRTQLAEVRYRLGVQPTFPGVMLTRIGWQRLPAWFLEQLESAYGGEGVTVGGQFWLSEQAESNLTPYVVALPEQGRGGDRYMLTALMGVGPNEHRFLTLDRQGRDLFDRLSADPDGCLLHRTAAERLGLARGDAVRIAGRVFRLAGVFDNELDHLHYLNGQRFGPIDLRGLNQFKRQLPDNIKNVQTVERVLQPSHIEADRELLPVSPLRFALVGAAAARNMGAVLRSVCIRADDPQRLEQIASDLSVQRMVPVYRSRGDDVEVVSARARMGVVGLGDLVVPLAIGALIVINTMINAVADQRATIHVYTSLGLAPVHVGAMFLSEAAAMGTLGVVGGFVAGQGFATVLRAGGLLSAVTLNYSSTSVTLTMAMVMAIVLLSALVPARMAGRLAAPAESRRWTLPVPVGDAIRMDLPFTVSESTAKGVVAFLHEWMMLHSVAGVGAFVGDEAFVYHDHDSDTRGVSARVWTAPFDQGVSQEVRIDIQPAPDEQGAPGTPAFYQVVMTITRLSGQTTPWLRSNRAFIVELRKQLLLWRALGEPRRAQYVQMSEQLQNVEQ